MKIPRIVSKLQLKQTLISKPSSLLLIFFLPSLVCYLLDSITLLLHKNEVSLSKHKIVIFDNLFHGVISACSWFTVTFSTGIFFNQSYKTSLIQLVFAGFFSCAIDLDHFIAAGSFDMKSALNLQYPASCFHSVFFQVSVNFMVFLFGKMDRTKHGDLECWVWIYSSVATRWDN